MTKSKRFTSELLSIKSIMLIYLQQFIFRANWSAGTFFSTKLKKPNLALTILHLFSKTKIYNVYINQ